MVVHFLIIPRNKFQFDVKRSEKILIDFDFGTIKRENNEHFCL